MGLLVFATLAGINLLDIQSAIAAINRDGIRRVQQARNVRGEPRRQLSSLIVASNPSRPNVRDPFIRTLPYLTVHSQSPLDINSSLERRLSQHSASSYPLTIQEHYPNRPHPLKPTPPFFRIETETNAIIHEETLGYSTD